MIMLFVLPASWTAGYQASTVTDATSEASGKQQALTAGVRQKPDARSDASSSKDSKSTAATTTTSAAAAGATGGGQNPSVIDVKMELALEMSKFIGEIEYQLDHVVPMADLCFVRYTLIGWLL